MVKRTHLTPPTGLPATNQHAMRRGGARRELSDRVVLETAGHVERRTLIGWALNVSRGGVRIVLEDTVTLGEAFAVAVGDDPTVRSGRIVWLQEEPDGFVCGIEYLLAPGEEPKTVPPPPLGSLKL